MIQHRLTIWVQCSGLNVVILEPMEATVKHKVVMNDFQKVVGQTRKVIEGNDGVETD